MNLTAAHIELLNEQYVLMQEQFVRDECQVADAQIEELFGTPTMFLMHCIVEGDDGRSYERFMHVDIEDESHELISRKDFETLADEYEDLNDSIPEL